VPALTFCASTNFVFANFWPLARSEMLRSPRHALAFSWARTRNGKNERTTIEFAREDDRFGRLSAENTMFRGASQATASELIGQATQKRSGESEFHDGLREWARIRERRFQKDIKAARASRSTSPRKRKLRKPTEPVEL
jgi:hypothetical protein